MGFAKGLKTGGGFLNDVDIEWRGYTFTTCPPRSDIKSAWVYVQATLRIDGSDVDITQHFFMGGVDRFAISEDGQEITMVAGGPVKVDARTPAGKLFASMLANKFPESRLPDLEAGEPLTLHGLKGSRFHIAQVLDEGNTRGQRQDPKTGKFYDRTNTVVTAVGALGPAPTMTRTKAAGGKPNGKAVQVQESTDVAELAEATLLAILTAAPNHTIEKAKLQMALFTALGAKHPQRNDTNRYLQNNDNLANIEGVTFDGQVIALEA